MKALIDGDVLVYASGFAAEETLYELYTNEEDRGTSLIETFKSKKELDAYVEQNQRPDYFIESVKRVPPVAHSLHNCKNLIERILDKVKASDCSIYLTGKDNFRDKVATIKGYKAHRDRDLKPAHYKEIKRYLIDVWGAIVVDGMEADDMLGIEHMKAYDDLDEYTVICTIDKDLDQVPGWHFNWKRDEMYIVTREEAIRYYAKQMLTGDSTDNIMGVPGIGDKKAEKILENVKLQDLPNVLKETYENKFTPEFIKTLGLPEHITWQDIYDEMDKLIRIKWYIDD